MLVKDVVDKVIADKPDYLVVCYANTSGQRTVIYSEMPMEMITFFLFMLHMAVENRVGQVLVSNAMKKGE